MASYDFAWPERRIPAGCLLGLGLGALATSWKSGGVSWTICLFLFLISKEEDELSGLCVGYPSSKALGR